MMFWNSLKASWRRFRVLGQIEAVKAEQVRLQKVFATRKISREDAREWNRLEGRKILLRSKL